MHIRLSSKGIDGFTLIEMMIVVGIIVVIGAVIGISLVGRRATTELTSTTQEMVALLREAQSDSMAQSQGASWGVHFANTTNTTPFFALFKTSYSTSTTVGYYTLPATVQYATTSLAQGNTLDITFAQITGIPSATASITLYLISYQGQNQSTTGAISRVSSGKVFFDDFNRSKL